MEPELQNPNPAPVSPQPVVVPPPPKKLSPALIWCLIAVVVAGIASWTVMALKPPAPLAKTVVAPENQTSDWKVFTDKQYNYQISYPPNFVQIFQDQVPTCVANNTKGWTSEQFFQEWKKNPPKITGNESNCADYPSYATITATSTTFNNVTAYQVTSMRGTYETICTYISNPRTLFAMCLPPEDPKSTTWSVRSSVYNKILSTFKFIK